MEGSIPLVNSKTISSQKELSTKERFPKPGNKTAVDGMTPYEALTGRKSNVSFLRTIGCVVYAHVPKDERKKLDHTGKRCILMGYGTNVN